MEDYHKHHLNLDNPHAEKKAFQNWKSISLKDWIQDDSFTGKCTFSGIPYLYTFSFVGFNLGLHYVI